MAIGLVLPARHRGPAGGCRPVSCDSSGGPSLPQVSHPDDLSTYGENTISNATRPLSTAADPTSTPPRPAPPRHGPALVRTQTCRCIEVCGGGGGMMRHQNRELVPLARHLAPCLLQKCPSLEIVMTYYRRIRNLRGITARRIKDRWTRDYSRQRSYYLPDGSVGYLPAK